MNCTASGNRTIVGATRAVVKWIAPPLLALLALFVNSAGAQAACPTPGAHANQDLKVDSACAVAPGEYHYRFVNVVANGSLTFTEATKSKTDFWASAVIIENGGAVLAGSSPLNPFGKLGGVLTIHLYGADLSKGDPLKIPGQGVLCSTKAPTPCGIPQAVWTNNGKDPLWGCGAASNAPGKNCIPGLPTNVSDYFYQYGPLYGDERCTDGSKWDKMSGRCQTANGQVGYFGYKVLAVSFGGRLQLFGYKGTCYFHCDPKLTHASWTRLRRRILGDDLDPKSQTNDLFIVDAPSNLNPENTQFSENDEFVVTSTDYLPGHSERFKVGCVNQKPGEKPTGPCVPFKPTGSGGWIQELKADHRAKWSHIGDRYGGPDSDKPLSKRLPDRIKNNFDPQLVRAGVETRAAVALLTRSIRIVSGSDADGSEFPALSQDDPCDDKVVKKACYSFGGHVVIRQGFQQVQIQGVEFAQLGQGGRLGHYPVHFHMARKTPNDTFVRDSSINESMTRWIVLHSTQGVLLAGNVGYLSIGHGFYLEDGSETDNRLYGNLGVFARAAVDNIQNFRHVPGILAYNDGGPTGFPYRSDNEYPSAFWVTNGWNDFIGNMAVGAGTCGACYWFVPAENSSMVDVPDSLPPPKNCPADGMHTYMKWSGYAGLQKHECNAEKASVPSSFAGTAPIKSFYGNFCSSAMHSFQTTSDAPACNGIRASNQGKAPDHLTGVKSIAPKPNPGGGEADDPYYPHYIGGRSETRCPLAAVQIPGQPPQYDCSEAKPCANGPPLEHCGVTVIDHYTSAFNWANGNVAAIWLRPKWYLLTNSVISDVQNAGLTFVTSGTYDRSGVVEGDWALALNTLFIGATQPENPDNQVVDPYASNAGPFNQTSEERTRSKLKCDNGAAPTSYCLNANEGVTMPLDSFFVNQRLFSIYDGPAYEDTNAYLDIAATPCADAECMYANTQGVRKGTGTLACYLPNAAIGWKQPNGFFYPPSFHSTNLFMDDVAIRHYVIDALWMPRTYMSNSGLIANEYCNPQNVSFANYSDIDRQTELNDDDGSLTGLTNDAAPKPTGTISVNPDQFFSAPVETPECLSNIGVQPTNTCGITQLTPTTATTSPYDYVTTAVIAGCGVDGPPGKPKPNLGRCGDLTKDEHGQPPDRVLQVIGRGGIWSRECSNPACYGVPLFRQFLTGNDGTNGQPSGEWAMWFTNKCNTANPPHPEDCRFPFVRMGGQSTYQRSTLTANHGTYYIDTTVPRDIQYGSAEMPAGEPFTNIVPCEFKPTGPCQPRSVNVFHGEETYTVYFLYAKSGAHATQQTYQVYVGEGFDLKTVQAVKVGLSTSPVTHVTPQKALPPKWQAHYNDQVACPAANPKCGILQVTVDFTDFDLSPTKEANGLCKPATFCKWSGGSCGCAFDLTDTRAQASRDPQRLVRDCTHTCSEWAVKDLDFKGDETWGFSFTLPKGFKPDATLANPSPHRPQPAKFPAPSASTAKPNWATKFMRTSTTPDNATGVCHYAKVPGTDCPAP
jgi:hypothetical protein